MMPPWSRMLIANGKALFRVLIHWHFNFMGSCLFCVPLEVFKNTPSWPMVAGTPRNAMAPTLHWCGLYCWAGGGSIWLGGCPAVGGGTGCQVEAVWDVLLLVKLKAYIIDSWIVWSPYEMLESSRSRWKLCLAVKFLNQRRGWTVDVGLHPSRSGVSGLDDIVRSAQCLENAHGGLSRGQPDPDEQDPSESSFTSHLHFDKNTLWTSLNNNMAFPYVGRRLAGMMVNELPGDIKRY